MKTNALGQLQVTSRVAKRAQYEAFEFSVTPDGVRVRNNSHATPEDHEYLVRVEEGVPTSCTCPADERFPGACKHRVAVAIRKPVLAAAVDQQLVADGGVQAQQSTGGTQEADACDCDGLPGEFPCWECFRSGEKDLPE